MAFKKFTYKIDGIDVGVESATLLGDKLHGMSSEKVFINEDGKYCFNQGGRLYCAEQMKATDKRGRSVFVDDILFDTENRVAGIIRQDQRILLIHRIKKGREYYAFPGGHRKRNESLEETLIREIKEETGVDVESAELFSRYNRKGFAEEFFYTVRDFRFKKIKLVNPDCKKGEVNEPAWLDVSACVSMDNILPQTIARKVFE